MGGEAGVGQIDDAGYVRYTVNPSLGPITLIHNLVCQAAAIYTGEKKSLFFFFMLLWRGS